MNRERRRERVDEGGLRWLLLLGGTLGVFAPLVLHEGGPGPLSPVQRLGCLVLVVGPALLAGTLEPRHEGVGSTLLQRAARLTPTALAMALGGALLFPTAWTWRYAWSLFVLHLPLPPLWHLPRARATSLGILSLAGLVSAALVPGGAWSLLAVALLWLGLPALDRAEALRGRLGPGIQGGASGPGAPRALAPTVLGVLGTLAVGGLVFALAVALLPPSQPLPEWATTPYGAQAPSARPGPEARVRAPLLELGLLLAGAGALMVLFQMGAGSRRKAQGELRAAGGMEVGSPAPLDPGALARAVEGWPAGPRRELVEAYLRHLERLAALGVARPPGASPLTFAGTVGGSCPSAAEAAQGLAAGFSQARWGPEPVAPEQARAARLEAEQVERALQADP